MSKNVTMRFAVFIGTENNDLKKKQGSISNSEKYAGQFEFYVLKNPSVVKTHICRDIITMMPVMHIQKREKNLSAKAKSPPWLPDY